MIDVSVIIVNYYSENLIKECIDSVLKNVNEIRYEIIIVDNGSDENGKTIMNSFDKKLCKIIDAKSNLGFGKANNLGAKHAKGKYLFLLNPDTVLINNAVKILFDYMEANMEVGVCGGNLFTPDRKPTPSFCREFDTLRKERSASRWPAIICKKISDVVNRNKQMDIDEFNYSDSPEDVAYVFGTDMLIKKELFDSIGGFDKDFFMYAEEAEFQKRISNLGYRIVCVPQSKIIHLEGATSSSSPRQFSMRMKGKMTYYDKCFSPNGASEFYKYRRLRMTRQMKWQRLKGKKPSTDSIDILDQVYAEYCNERGA